MSIKHTSLLLLKGKACPTVAKNCSQPLFSAPFIMHFNMESGGYWERKREREPEEGRCLKELLLHVHYPSFHFSTKCDPGIQTRCHHSPRPTPPSPHWFEGRRNIWHLHAKTWSGGKWRVVGEKRKLKGPSPTESREHGEQIGSWKVLQRSWWFDAVPSGPEPPTSAWLNYRCLGLVSMVTDWGKIVIHVLFTVGLFMPYGGWISNEQLSRKSRSTKLKGIVHPKWNFAENILTFRQFKI